MLEEAWLYFFKFEVLYFILILKYHAKFEMCLRFVKQKKVLILFLIGILIILLWSIIMNETME